MEMNRPSRIWAMPAIFRSNGKLAGNYGTEKAGPGDTEYVRADLHEEAERRAEAAEARAARMEEALRAVRELNMTAEDEDGHRWANSDLIEQEIVAALTDTPREGETR